MKVFGSYEVEDRGWEVQPVVTLRAHLSSPLVYVYSYEYVGLSIKLVSRIVIYYFLTDYRPCIDTNEVIQNRNKNGNI